MREKRWRVRRLALPRARRCRGTGKRCHAGWYGAVRHLKRLARATRQGVGRLHVYRCPHCLWWHVGHDREALKEGGRSDGREPQ